MEWVREALGYEQLDLNAVSYGTTLALRYIADYPKRVRTAVLYGTVAPKLRHRVFMPARPKRHFNNSRPSARRTSPVARGSATSMSIWRARWNARR